MSSTGHSPWPFGTDRRSPLSWLRKQISKPNLLRFLFVKEEDKTRKSKIRKQNVRGAGASIFVQLIRVREHDDRDLSITENGELASFLEKTTSPFGVRDLPVRVVLDLFDLYLSTTHIVSTSLPVYSSTRTI